MRRLSPRGRRTRSLVAGRDLGAYALEALTAVAYLRAADDLRCIEPFYSAYPTSTVLDIQAALDTP